MVSILLTMVVLIAAPSADARLYNWGRFEAEDDATLLSSGATFAADSSASDDVIKIVGSGDIQGFTNRHRGVLADAAATHMVIVAKSAPCAGDGAKIVVRIDGKELLRAPIIEATGWQTYFAPLPLGLNLGDGLKHTWRIELDTTGSTAPCKRTLSVDFGGCWMPGINVFASTSGKFR